MTVNNLVGKPLKHYAQNKKTNARYVMICLENDTDPNTCSVVDIDDLDSDMRSELTNVINCDECQGQSDPWKVLDKKFFYNYPKATMLNILRALRKIKVVNSEDVAVMLPNNETKTPKEIADAIRIYQNQKEVKGFNPEVGVETIKKAEDEKVVKVSENQKDDIKEIKDQLSMLTGAISNLVSALQPKEETKETKHTKK